MIRNIGQASIMVVAFGLISGLGLMGCSPVAPTDPQSTPTGSTSPGLSEITKPQPPEIKPDPTTPGLPEITKPQPTEIRPGPTIPGLPPVIQPPPTVTMPIMPTMPFDRLNQGETYIADLEKPAVFVAASPSEMTRFSAWLDPDVAGGLKAVDFSKALVVAVFSKTGSSGNLLAIRSVSVTSGAVHVTVESAMRGELGGSVIAYPYDIIRIPREGLPTAPGTNWIVSTSEGVVLAQTKYP